MKRRTGPYFLVMFLFLRWLVPGACVQAQQSAPWTQSRIDSLKQLYTAATDDSTRGALCRGIGYGLRKLYRTGESMSWFERSIRHDTTAGQYGTAARTWRVLGGGWRTLDNRLRAMEAYERSLRMYTELDDTLGLVQATWNIAQMHTTNGDYTQSMHHYRKAYEMAEAVGDTGLIASTLFLIGVEHDFMGEKDEGIRCLRRCLALREQLGNPRLVEFTLVILAAINTNGGYYDKALTHLARSRAIADSLGDKARIATNHHSVGRIFREQGDTVTAIAYEQQALRLYREAGSLRDIDWTLRLLGTLYSKTGKYDSAMYCFNEALAVTDSLGQQRGRVRWHCEQMARHYARMGDFTRAIAYQRRYMALADSAYNAATLRRINELTAAYESDLRERKIAILDADRVIDSLRLLQYATDLERQRSQLHRKQQEAELLAASKQLQQLRLARAADTLRLRERTIALGEAEHARQRRRLALRKAGVLREEMWRNISAGGLGAVLLLAFVVLRTWRQRRADAELHTRAAERRVREAEAHAAKQQADIARQEHALERRFTTQLIATQEQERKRIAGALHDGIGQDLLIIKHRAHMAQDDAEQRREHLGDIMHIAVEAVEDVRRLCRDLRPYQLERVGLTETLRGMLASLRESTSLTIHADIESIDGLIPPEREIDLYRVAQEGLNNVIKHAEATTVNISLSRDGDSLHLRIRDDGRGFDPAATSQGGHTGGMGLLDMTERLHLLGGAFRIESTPGSGTHITATIPVGNAPPRHGKQSGMTESIGISRTNHRSDGKDDGENGGIVFADQDTEKEKEA